MIEKRATSILDMAKFWSEFTDKEVQQFVKAVREVRLERTKFEQLELRGEEAWKKVKIDQVIKLLRMIEDWVITGEHE